MPQTLFANANLLLDGLAELRPSFNVLVKDGRIVAVSQKPVDVRDAAVIDVDRRPLPRVRPKLLTPSQADSNPCLQSATR
jgi:hypothetical protein